MNQKPITLYPNCQSREGREADWPEVCDMIRGQRLAAATEEVRRAVASRDNRGLKRLKSGRLPAIMVCCRCSEGRDMLHLTGYTGVCQADFDHLTPERLRVARRRLVADPHVVLLHTSASGAGLHVFYRYDLGPAAGAPTAEAEARYLQAFRQGNRYLSEVACADSDQAMEPPVHLACLCHDPEVYFNPRATLFPVDMAQEMKKPTRRERLTNDQPRRERDWSPVWTADEVCRMALSLRQSRSTYVRGQRHHFLVGLLFLLSDYGVDETTACRFLEVNFSDYTDESLAALTADCYRRSAGTFGMRRLPTHNQGRPLLAQSQDQQQGGGGGGKRVTLVELIRDYLCRQPLRFDVLTQKIQMRQPDGQWADLTDRQENDLYLECSRHLGQNFQSSSLRSVLNSSTVPRRHPLRDYVLSLPAWDPSQPDYIGQVLSMVTVVPQEAELWLWAARKWFVAMVAGWMADEVVNHELLVLIGAQGIYKTTWIEALMPPALRHYTSKQATVRFLDKDEQLRAAEFGLINLDEIDSLTNGDLNALKSLVSATYVNVRASYGRNKQRRQRVASYAASGNKDEFLTDHTGNRRWLPFHVLGIQNPFRYDYPYEGLYAQAWYLVSAGFQYWFDGADIQRMTTQTERFAQVTPEEQLLPVYFQPCPRGTAGAVMLTAAEILGRLATYGNLRRTISLRQMCSILAKSGYERVCLHGRRGYIAIEKSSDSIQSERRLGAMGADDE